MEKYSYESDQKSTNASLERRLKLSNTLIAIAMLGKAAVESYQTSPSQSQDERGNPNALNVGNR